MAQFAGQILKADDEIVISIMEHHSNIVPWQEVAKKTGAILKFVYLKEGELDMEDLRQKSQRKRNSCQLLMFLMS